MAEDQHYKVVIIGHSPNQQNRKIWSENYYNITNRYGLGTTIGTRFIIPMLDY